MFFPSVFTVVTYTYTCKLRSCVEILLNGSLDLICIFQVEHFYGSNQLDSFWSTFSSIGINLESSTYTKGLST